MIQNDDPASRTSPFLNHGNWNGNEDDLLPDENILALHQILAMLAPGFSWGCISTTMLLLIIPLECQRLDASISMSENNVSSVFVSLFVFLLGLTELLCPVLGRLSDKNICIPNYWGRRIPFILLGSTVSISSLVCMTISSWYERWIIYALAYTLFMIGMNIIYSSMIALIPDLISPSQVGQSNGLMALEMVLGSVFGFVMFQFFNAYNNFLPGHADMVRLSLFEMYVLYILVLFFSSLLTLIYTEEKTNVNPVPFENDAPVCCGSFGDNASNTFFVDIKDEMELIVPTNVTSRPTYSIQSLLFVWKRILQQCYSLRARDMISVYSVSPQKHGDFFYVTISRTFFYMGLSVQTFFLFYVHDLLRDHSALARRSPQTLVSELAFVVQVAGVFTSYPAGYISDKCFNRRRKPLIYWSCAALSIGTLALIFVRYVSELQLICIVVGLANGAYLTMETSLAVDCLHKMEQSNDGTILEELRHDGTTTATTITTTTTATATEDKEGSAQLLGIWGVASFVGVALGPLIGGPLLFIFGNINRTNSDDVFDDDYIGGQEYGLLGYVVIFILSAIYFILGAIILRHVRQVM